MSFKPEFQVQGAWYDNAQRFATADEAKETAQARFMVWTMPTDYRVTESPDPVNYRRVDGRDAMLCERCHGSGLERPLTEGYSGSADNCRKCEGRGYV